MTPSQFQILCTHAPNYQRGCLACSIRYMKMLRPSREKQDAYLATLPADRAQQVKEILKEERNAA